MTSRTYLQIILSCTTLLALACSASKDSQQEAVGNRVENPALAIAVAMTPPPFELHENAGDQLRFRAPGPAADGLLSFTVGPTEAAGINLINAVEYRKAAFAELPDGQYFGNLELGTPMGTAFTARGAYSAEGEPVEEIWVYTIHPSANRLLTLTYTYPEGESQDRMGQLVQILGEIEGLEVAPEPEEPIRIEG